jgi:hypothetical protein
VIVTVITSALVLVAWAFAAASFIGARRARKRMTKVREASVCHCTDAIEKVAYPTFEVGGRRIYHGWRCRQEGCDWRTSPPDWERVDRDGLDDAGINRLLRDDFIEHFIVEHDEKTAEKLCANRCTLHP